MAHEDRSKRIATPMPLGRGDSGSPVAPNLRTWNLTEAENRLRTVIVQHYAWVATFDREYAEWAYRRTRESMPWLKL